MDDPERWQERLLRASIIADPRKFPEYVLVPDYPGGKGRIFLETLGFRPHSAADAWALARLYEEQARDRIVSGDVLFGGTIPFGDRCRIVMTVRGLSLRTGWLLADDVLRLITPFSGFAGGPPKG